MRADGADAIVQSIQGQGLNDRMEGDGSHRRAQDRQTDRGREGKKTEEEKNPSFRTEALEWCL